MLPQRRLPAREVECRLGGSIIKNCFLEQNHDVTGSHLSPTATEQTANVAEDHDDVPHWPLTCHWQACPDSEATDSEGKRLYAVINGITQAADGRPPITARLSSTELHDWEDGRGTPAGVRTDDAAEAGVPGLDVARRRTGSAESGVDRDVVVFRLGDVAGCLHRASMGLGVDAEPRRGGGIPSRVLSIQQCRCSVDFGRTSD
jgi:hypothetical protein